MENTNDTIETIETSAKVNTRLTKDGDKHETMVTLNWDIGTDELIKLAQQSVIIKLQSNYRAAESVPKEDTQNVSELIKKSIRVKKAMTPQEIMDKASGDESFKEELLKLLKENK